MNLDFSVVLISVILVCFGILLIDKLAFAASRQKKLQTALEGLEGQYKDQGQLKMAHEEILERYQPHWLVDLASSIFKIFLIVLLLRSFVFEPFNIPSGSMRPTLLEGDFILVNKYTYGLRLPVVGTKILDVGLPERGDILVFKVPKDRKTPYIKRVIGLPGDVIDIRGDQVSVNGEWIEQKELPLGPYDNPLHKQYVEYLGSQEHRMQVSVDRILGNYQVNFPYKVPDNHYFVMGDNRRNSLDSRFWGPVPEELIMGKAVSIWFHWWWGQYKPNDWPTFERNTILQ